MRGIIALVVACLTAACSPQSAATIAPENVAQPLPSSSAAGMGPGASRRALPINAAEVVQLVTGLGPGWQTMTPLGGGPDSFTGGYRRSLMSSDRSADIYTLPAGGVWDVRVQSGIDHRCGSPDVIVAAINPITTQIGLSRPLAPTERARLVQALRTKDGSAKIAINDITIGATGGCLATLDIRTTTKTETAA